jgi:hypothetical protein
MCDGDDEGGKIPSTFPNCPELETLEPDPLRAGSLSILCHISKRVITVAHISIIIVIRILLVLVADVQVV